MSRALSIALMLESDGPAGAEVVVLELAKALRRRGHAVHPIGPARGDGWLGRQFRDQGIETHTFDLRRTLDTRCVRALTGLLRRLEVDVMHGHEFDGAIYGTLAARLAGCRSVITLHGNQSMTARWRRRAALRWAFRRAHAVFAVSHETKGQLDRDLGLPPSAIAVIHNGMPIRSGDAAPVREELGLQPEESLILAVGSLMPRKGHMVLLKALARIHTASPELRWRLAIAGGPGGTEHEGLEAFARDRGLANRVHVLTYRDDVANLLAAADVFTMPSLWEGFPLAILEAMLARKPVIASDVCGIPEAIDHGDHGLLVPPGDDAALAAALERLLREPALRTRLAAAAHDRACREFTIDAMAAAYERAYGIDSDGGHALAPTKAPSGARV